MTNTEKFSNFTIEHWEKFDAVSNEQELAAFLTEIDMELSAEEKSILQAMLKTSKEELSDEQMAEATGGAFFQLCPFGKRFEHSYKSTGPNNSCYACPQHTVYYHIYSKIDISTCHHYNICYYPRPKADATSPHPDGIGTFL